MFAPFVDNVSQNLVLERLSRDGSAIFATLKLSNSLIVEKSPTQQYRVPFSLQLDSCIDRFGQKINRPSESFKEVGAILDSLRRSTFADYARCTLVPSLKATPPIDRLPSPPKIDLDGFSFEVFKEKPSEISIIRSSALVGKLEREGVALDPISQTIAIEAANIFTSMVIDQYGDLLFSLSENSKLSGQEKEEAVKAYLLKNGPLMKTQLDTIDREFPKLTLMTKISILLAINDMYAKIDKIEKMVTNNRSISLDRVVQRRL